MQQRDAKNTPRNIVNEILLSITIPSFCCQLPVQQTLNAYSLTLFVFYYLMLPRISAAIWGLIYTQDFSKSSATKS